MARRKTIDVADVRRMGNTALAAPDAPYEQRVGLAWLLEQVLFDSGNYRGFGYLSSELAAPGVLRHNHDDFRRIYY